MTRASLPVACHLALEGAHGDCVVHALRGVEEVSRAFRYEVDFSTEDLDPDALPGTAAHVVVRDAFGHQRHVDGLVESLSALASDRELTRYRAVLRPAPFLVSYRHQSRIFQHKSVPEIVQRVFREAGIEDRYFRWSLGESYPPREYCVQYDESEWDFVARLLEDEGIWFAFEHSAEGHVMALSDASDVAPTLDPPALPFVHDDALHGDALKVWAWSSRERPTVAKVALDDYDPLQPAADLRAAAEVADSIGRERYEYPGGYVDHARGRRLARVRLEEERSTRHTARGTTNAVTVAPGGRLALEGHPTADGEYFVTRAELRVRLDHERSNAPLVDPGTPECEVTFEGVPRDQRFRPARVTPRPRIVGVQTAVVTGIEGEEIHTDEHARVKLQFHWDREGCYDHETSCWVRVAQAHTTGAVMIPRYGWEVLVEFVDGDPDRPLCMGRLFHELHPPHFELPARKTVSALRTLSSPGAEGVNELLFDDQAGGELIGIHGHRDVRLVAANDLRATTTREVHVSIVGERQESVGGGASLDVQGAQSLDVGEDQGVTVGAARAVKVLGGAAEEVTGDQAWTVEGTQTLHVGTFSAGAFEDMAGEAEAVLEGATGRAGSGELEPADEALDNAMTAATEATTFVGAPDGDGPGEGRLRTWSTTVDGAVTETIGGTAAVLAGEGIWSAVGEDARETTAGAWVECVGRGRAETTGGSRQETVGSYELVATDALSIEASGNVEYEVSGDLQQTIAVGHEVSAGGALALTGNEVTLQAAERIVLKCGPAQVVITADAIEVKGLQVKVEGTSKIELTQPAIGPG